MTERKKTGLPPGSVVFTGEQKVARVQVHHLRYDGLFIKEEAPFKGPFNINFSQKLTTHKEQNPIEWIDVRGLHNTHLIEQLGGAFQIHALVLENMVDVEQRPKFEEYDSGIFLLLKALHFDGTTLDVEREQVSIYFSEHFLLSLQEKSDDLFDAIRKRLHQAKGKIRTKGTDYLAYALMDTIIDRYYVILDQIEACIERLELEIQANVQATSKDSIYALKRQLLAVRKDIAPLREVLGRLHRSDSILLSEHSDLFLRDLHNQSIQIIDSLDNYKDAVNGLHDLYLAEISFQQNKVIQLLTIVTTIFVPLSFLAGLYGMNFEYMPELHTRYGYFVLLGVMLLIFVSGIYYFRRQNWL